MGYFLLLGQDNLDWCIKFKKMIINSEQSFSFQKNNYVLDIFNHF